MLASVALLGGCAAVPAQGDLAAASPRDGRAVARGPVTQCTTTWLVLATVSRCGSGGLRFGVATE